MCMIGDRLIQIVRYLEKNNTTSYKDIANELNLKERQVRYDIERINDVLIDHQLKAIEKCSKGVLKYTHSDHINTLFEINPLIYTNEQRIDFILLIALFDTKNLNLRKLSEDFEVSRSSIKNDVNTVIKLLKEQGLHLSYNHEFILTGSNFACYQLMSKEFTKYIYIYGRKRVNFNAYEKYAMCIFKKAYQNLQVKEMITWIKRYLEERDIVLSDASFRWYIANIMVTFWYFLKEIEHPFDKISDHALHSEIDDEKRNQIEKIIDMDLDAHKRIIIERLLDYTNHTYFRNEEREEISSRIVATLISKMVTKLQFNFGNDDILYEGLLNHMQPLLQRIHDDVEISIGDMPQLSEEELFVIEQVKIAVNEIEELKHLKSDIEIAYIGFHFIAGLKRRASMKNKKVLLVCGLGYALTKVIEETLQSEFQIQIIDTIPSYKLHLYQNLEDVEVIISTMHIEIELSKPYVYINPFLQEEDYLKLSTAKIYRKKLLPNYFGIYSRLDFLPYHDREKVMQVIQEELGYTNIRNYKNVLSLIDILRLENILLLDTLNLEESKGALLELFKLEHCTNQVMKNEDFEEYKTMWMDDDCMLLHNIDNHFITKSKMAMIILKQPYHYGNKDIKILFACVSKEPLENILAIKQLSKLFMRTNFINQVKQCTCVEAVYQNLLYYVNKIK